MNERPEEARLADLPREVLCVDLDPLAAALRCGGTLAWHARRGDRVEALFAAGSGAASAASDREALGELCPALVEPRAWTPPQTVGLDEHPAPASDPLLVERLRASIAAAGARLVYGPDDSRRADVEQRALARALRSAVAGLEGVRLHASAAADSPDAGALLRVDLPDEVVASKRRAAGASADAGIGSEAFRESAPGPFFAPAAEGPQATAVICTWNKSADVRANLEALRAQTRPFAGVVVVDNASRDDTAAMIASEFPEVRLIVMPHSNYGACETFNIGFASATTEWTVILDDDVVLPPAWLERAAERLLAEPDSTAILSSKIVEPGMPESYRSAPEINRERYMSTFRGCASLAKSEALARAGGYDERLYIYGNERDLTCRLLNLGYRVLQYPGVAAFHKTPFGVQMGKRSLYFHARNAWLGMLKYAPLADLARMPFLVVTRVLLRGRAAEEQGEVSDATGTIGLGKSLRETPGAWWVLVKAGCSVLANVPYCLRHRQPVRAPDFELPIK